MIVQSTPQIDLLKLLGGKLKRKKMLNNKNRLWLGGDTKRSKLFEKISTERM